MKKIKQIAVIFIIIFIAQGIIKGLNTTKTIVIRNAQADVEEYIPTPCGLREVVCEGEDTRQLPEDKPAQLGKDKDDIGIVALIAQTFGDEAENAKKVFMCESHYNPKTVGDTKIAYWENGHLYGRSIGIAQVRMLPGRTDNPEEYEKEMMNPVKNIVVAKKIFDGQGWAGWYNCAKQVGIINR